MTSQLRVEFLGSAGAVRTPRPRCDCELCQGARRYGIPWARSGPSVFVHGPDVLIDTPEESCMQLDRAGIPAIAAAFYSHWHPDHTAGRRVFETRNQDFRRWPPQNICTPVYLPPQVAADFEVRLGLAENLAYLQSRGVVDVRPFDSAIDLNGWRISAFPVAETYVYAFLFAEIEGPRRVLIAMDELVGWIPPSNLAGIDLAILPVGVFEYDPISGQRRIPLDHPVLKTEATYRQTLEMVEALAPKKLIFAHIEEPDGNMPAQFARMSHELRLSRGWDVTFAYDTLMVDLPE